MEIVKKIWRHIEPYTVISKGYIKSFAWEKVSDNQCDDIDFVVTWVDGSDPKWMEQKIKYSEQIGGTPRGNGKCRYRNWECFKYWFRAVEKYAPWVHNVYLVTWGHVPKWLNVECPKLKIINHTDFMPAEYLPTFNCNPLELNLHRIPGLSEHFVYFNDDVLLNRPCKPTDFFINGKPLHTAVAYPMMCRENQTPYHIFFGTIGLINVHNHIQALIRQHPEKWFSHIYSRNQIRINAMSYRENFLFGLVFSHMGVPMCKHTMEKVWGKYPELHEMCKNKFRTAFDYAHLVFTAEDLLNGNFVPVRSNYFGHIIPMDDLANVEKCVSSQHELMVCYSDSEDYSEDVIEKINKKMTAVYDTVLGEKSTFEL